MYFSSAHASFRREIVNRRVYKVVVISLLLGFFQPLFSEDLSEASLVHRKLLVGDYEGVRAFARAFLKENRSGAIARSYLDSLALSARFSEWVDEYFRLITVYPELEGSRDLLEVFSMEILKKGLQDPSQAVRGISLLASGMAGDYRLVSNIIDALSDDHDRVRALAFQVAGSYGTYKICDAIKKEAFSRSSLPVRLTCYQLCVELGLKEVVPQLIGVSSDRRIVAQERRAAIRAIAGLVEPQEFIEYFPDEVFSPTCRGQDKGRLQGLDGIELAYFLCESSLRHEIKNLFPLFSLWLDHGCIEVQKEILLAAIRQGKEALKKEEAFLDKVRNLMKVNSSMEVRSLSAAVLFLADQEDGLLFLKKGLDSSKEAECQSVSEALCHLGVHSGVLAREYLDKVVSKRSLIDLATILLVSRCEIEKSGDVIKDLIENGSDKGLSLFEVSEGVKKLLFFDRKEDYFRNGEQEKGFQDKENYFIGRHFVRLLMLSGYSKNREVFLSFSSKHRIPEGAYFFGMFLEDSNEQEASALLARMQDDEEFALRLEASMLALRLHKDSESLNRVLTLYSDCSWYERIMIIESIAVSGNREALPFLLKGCKSSLPTLRVALAGAIFALFK